MLYTITVCQCTYVKAENTNALILDPGDCRWESQLHHLFAQIENAVIAM